MSIEESATFEKEKSKLLGDLDPTTSGLSHLPPSSERMGHYLCVGVQDRMVIAL